MITAKPFNVDEYIAGFLKIYVILNRSSDN
jgi:hypothetical protein